MQRTIPFSRRWRFHLRPGYVLRMLLWLRGLFAWTAVAWLVSLESFARLRRRRSEAVLVYRLSAWVICVAFTQKSVMDVEATDC
jgi:hypothetical protein